MGRYLLETLPMSGWFPTGIYQSVPTGSADGKKKGFLDKHPKLKRIVDKSQALLYIFFNSILPAIDVISDFLTFNELIYRGNPKWAWVTLFCIFLPFLFKGCMFFKDLVRKQASLQNLAGLLLHFPLVSPLIFATLGLRLRGSSFD